MDIELVFIDFYNYNGSNRYKYIVTRTPEVEEGKTFYKDGERYKIISFQPTTMTDNGKPVEIYVGIADKLHGDSEAKRAVELLKGMIGKFQKGGVGDITVGGYEIIDAYEEIYGDSVNAVALVRDTSNNEEYEKPAIDILLAK